MEVNELFSTGFDRLEPGQEIRTYGRTITEADLAAFAGVTGDFHPLHTDAQWAAASPFGERIAHGLLVLSCSVGLAPIDPERVVALRGFERVVFKRPVRPGETIHLEARVERLKELDADTGLVTFAWRVLNQDGRLVVRAEVEIVWRREPEVAPAPGPRFDAMADDDHVPDEIGAFAGAAAAPRAVYL